MCSPSKVIALWLLGIVALLGSGCATLPPRPDVALESALEPAATGEIRELSDRFRLHQQPGKSGFKLLVDAKDSMEARLALIDLAQRSIDIQTFIWSGDAAGTLLFDRLLQAADRGVRVRIIVDDIWFAQTTKNLAALNVHPNLEIRLFNPNPMRDDTIGSVFSFLASFQELNRRMHNKLMIVDNLALIGGGRNIGDPYFGLSSTYNFVDIDVLAVGPVIAEASKAYDAYWNHRAVYPVKGFSDLLPAETLDELRTAIAEILDEYGAQLSSYPLDRQNWRSWSAELSRQLVAGTAHFLQDDPVHIDGKSYRLVDMIAYLKDPAEEEFLLATPYLIPVGPFLDILQEGVDDGIRVRILTNSLGSTNHTLVNSHYKKYRRSILETGTELHEFHHAPPERIRSLADVEPITSEFVSLHAKVFISDARRCFIGSLNFDPRALVINSENGLLIDSEELGTELTDFLEDIMSADSSWQVTLDPDDRLIWQTTSETTYSQPGRNFWQRITDFFGRLLPIESQL